MPPLDPIDFDEIDFDAVTDTALEDDEADRLAEVDDDDDEGKDEKKGKKVDDVDDEEDLGEDSDDEDEEDEEDEEKEGDEVKDEEEDEEEEEDDDGEDTTVVGQLKAQFGFDFGDEEFEDTEEGVIKLATAAAQKKAEQIIESRVKSNPDASNFWEYLEAGGDPAKYIQTMSPNVNYLEVEEIGEDNVALQERMVKDYLTLTGENEEAINEAVEEYKAAGILQSEAKRSLSRLQREQKEEQESLIEEQKELSRQRRQEVETYFNGLREKIDNSKDFHGLPITEKEKDPFFAFIKPNDENGVSEYAKAVQDLDAEELLAIQYLVYKGFDLNKLIKTKAATSKAKSLTDKLNSSSGDREVKNSNRDSRERSRGSVRVDDLDLEAIG